MLGDITVLDLSLQLPGPYCTTLLVALGARVVKVEPPGGDPARHLDPPMFGWLAAGKTSVVLDLRTGAGQEVLHRLALVSDVVVEGYRPGVADRLGAGFGTLSKLNPGLVYASISGYGQSGPYHDLPGHDINYLGAGGGLAIGQLQPPPEDGVPIGLPIVDLAAGSAAAFLAVAALRERATTGRGRYLDIAMVDHAAYWSCLKAGSVLVPRNNDDSFVDRSDHVEGEPTYGAFCAADGEYLTIGILEDKFWSRLCSELGWNDFLRDQKMATYDGRKQHRRVIISRLKETIATRARTEWLDSLTAAGLPVAPVHSLRDVARDPQLSTRTLFTTGSNGNLRLMPPLPVSVRHPRFVTGRVPELGSGTRPLLSDLGYSPEEQLALQTAGAFGAQNPVG